MSLNCKDRVDYPLISVVITTFQRPRLLQRAIMSVLSQSYSNFEIVVVDDNFKGSIERRETEQVVNAITDKRIRYLVHDSNRGANFARNTGLICSKGEYITFLDDDDEYFKDKLARQVEVAVENATIDGILVFCGFEVVGNRRLNNSRWHLKKGSKLYYPNSSVLFSGNFIGSNSFILIDRIAINRVGGYDVNLQSSQDWDFYIELSKAGVTFIGIPDVLVRYHAFEDPNSITGNREKRIQGFLKIEEKHKQYAAEMGALTIKSFYRYLYRRTLFLDLGVGLSYFKKLLSLVRGARDAMNILIDFLYVLYYLFAYSLKFSKQFTCKYLLRSNVVKFIVTQSSL